MNQISRLQQLQILHFKLKPTARIFAAFIICMIVSGNLPHTFATALGCFQKSSQSTEDGTLNTAEENSTSAIELKVAEKGPINRLKKSIAPLLRLKLSDKTDFLTLDRSQWESENQSEKDRLQTMIASLVDRGVDPAKAKDLAAKMGRTSSSTNTPLDNMFNKVRADGRMNSSGRSHGRGRTQWTGESAEMTCALNVSGNSCLFQINEIASPNRTLIFRQSDNLTSFMLIGFDWSVVLRQIDGKMLSMTLMTEGDTTYGKSASFVEFTKEHPQLCRRVLDILSTVGVDAPPMPSSPAVNQYVTRIIQERVRSGSTRLDELIKKLDAPEFQSREEASKAITDSFAGFEMGIADRLAKGDLSIEATKRLREISKLQASGAKTDPRIKRCAEVFKLAGSPKYITGLLAGQSEEVQKTLIQYLTKTTGQKFGNDVKAWENWGSER